MIYPYIVNKNGIWYAAGEDVPENNLKEVEKSTSTDCRQSPRQMSWIFLVLKH